MNYEGYIIKKRQRLYADRWRKNRHDDRSRAGRSGKIKSPKMRSNDFDFTNVEYITSAGMRVLVYAQRELMKKGGVTVTGVNEKIKKVFTVTGMHKVLKIE